MRPNRLKMTYFGPFEHEMIDFSQVHDQMFLISGKTGSGKTMIFDAIMFALYGEPSTSDRSEHSLRSQFAADEAISTVTFEFTVRGQTYTVERQLSYQKEGRVSKVPSKAVLYDAKMRIITSQVREVTAQVEGIIKLSANQFRQILVLPQGEFKRLLMSKSEEKQAILRTLFQTERFVRFELTVKELRKEKNRELELYESRIDELFNTVIFEEPAAATPSHSEKLSKVQEAIEHYKEESQALTDASNKEKETIDGMTAELKREEAHNEKLKELNDLTGKLNALNKNRSHINALEEKLKRYREAAMIQYELRKEHEVNEELTHLANDESQYKTRIDDNHSKQRQEEETFNRLKDEEADIKAREKWLSQTERYLSEDYEDIDQRIAKGKDMLCHEQKATDERTEQLKALEETVQNTQVSQEDIDEKNAEVFRLEQEKSETDRKIKEEAKHLQTDEKVARQKEDKARIEQELNGVKREIADKEDSLKSRYNQEDRVHIEHLFGHLKVGEACPVCQQDVAVLPRTQIYLSEEDEHLMTELNERKEQLEQQTEERSKDLAVETRLQKDAVRHDYDTLIKTGHTLEGHIRDAKGRVSAMRDALTTLDHNKERIAGLKEDISAGHLKLEKYRHRLDKLDEMLDDFKRMTGHDAFQTFSQAYRETQKYVTDFNDRYKALSEVIDSYRNEALTLAEGLKYSQNRIKKLTADVDAYTKAVDAFLKERQFPDRASVFELLELKNINGIEEEINTFHQDERFYTKRMDELEATLETQEAYDLTRMKDELKQHQDRLDDLTNKRASADNTLQHNRNVHDKLNAYISDLSEDLKEMNRLSALVDLVSGKNHKKVSLERYVLTYYLERILDLANIRLLEMTGHRYELRRSTEMVGRQTGLDIEVFDYYNNNRRHITSLSGGETFQASLTLALALNEALQQESGGISLDTMLIDEGFGTLDAETLDIAISTLIDLQSSGKTIGIISHVAELKERMEKILYVVADDEKSHTDFNDV